MIGGLATAGFTIMKTWGDFDGQPIRSDSPEWIILARSAEQRRG